MVGTGHVVVTERRVFRDPFGEPVEPAAPPELSADQKGVFERVLPALEGGFHRFLLSGVTGSGKTEVYLRLAAAAAARGRPVLVLVPEIALISQIARRFRGRFGDAVAVLHSGLSGGERFDEWSRILEGKATIVVGARSAVFAPVVRPGLIVVDEEHDGSYKQEQGLRYHARDLAVVRARQAGAVVLLGSATPSVESVANAASGKFAELVLPRRIRDRPMADVEVIDLRLHRDARGIDRWMAPALREAIGETIRRGEQALLFLNRRGFASFPVCAACGEAIRCRHCDISLTLHKAAHLFRCHYCGFGRAASDVCPACGAPKVRLLGLGTEKVEEALAALFPSARIARMDRDAVSRKGALLRILRQLRDGKIDVVVGTQMVAKGHDFPNITLVGILCADLSLNVPDFRAGERTFQLLAQVAGRAGRGASPGRVLLQTFNPGHFSIRAACSQDFRAFYGKEIEVRRSLGYPPFTRLAQLKISGRDGERARQGAEALGEAARGILSEDPERLRGLQLLGPIEAPLSRIAGRHRWQLLVKAPGPGVLHRYLRRLLPEGGIPGLRRDPSVTVDVDPYSFQ
jgi:primosomal protein N' (replication factor Y)